MGASERVGGCVSTDTHAIAKTWNEAECSSHANEVLGNSDGGEQGAVKASLVLILSSAQLLASLSTQETLQGCSDCDM